MHTTELNHGPLAGKDGRPPPLHLRAAGWLEGVVLPLGLLVLLTGMLWAEERPEYHTLFYALVAFPAFLLLLIKRDTGNALLRSPVFLAFLAFAACVMLSIAWSDTDKSFGSLIKRPLYIALLFAAVTQVALARTDRLKQVLQLATLLACLVGVVSLVLFHMAQDDRFVGYRALSNPILTAHVFGFFMAMCVASWMIEGSNRRPWKAITFVIIGTVIVATGARGGLAATAAAITAAALLAGNRRAAIACVVMLAGAALVLVLVPDVFMQRGLSLRPQLWALTLQEVSLRPWLGYGYDAYIMLEIPGVTEKFPNPHNLLLAVLRQQGIVGLTLWGLMYAAAFVSAWRYRRDPAVLIFAVTVVAGLVASLTEGMSYLSRPKEHWFLVWIPFAFLTAALIRRKLNPAQTP